MVTSLWLAIARLLTLKTSLPADTVPNKLAANVPNIMPQNSLFFYFFAVVSLTHFINGTYSSRDLIIFKISFFSSFNIINIVPDPKMFFY